MIKLSQIDAKNANKLINLNALSLIAIGTNLFVSLASLSVVSLGCIPKIIKWNIFESKTKT